MALRTQSTFVIIFGALVTSAVAAMETSTNQALSSAAIALGCTLMIAFLIESRAGLRNLFRVDILMLFALYGLTLAEFLAEQDDLSIRVSREAASSTIDVVLVAFCGLALGRHAYKMYASHTLPGAPTGLTTSQMTALVVACAAIGYLHILLAVDFDIFEAITQMMRPRFSQPWTRGRLGGIDSLLNELGLLIYLIPPLAGAVLAEHRRYSLLQKITVGAIISFTFFYGLAGGTRFIFLTYLLTFGASYMMMRRNLTWWSLFWVGTPFAVVGLLAVYFMAAIRTYGLQDWSSGVESTTSFFVDMNILNIAGLIRAIPDQYDYLGFEIPFTALIRPIPRALWPGKPEGLSASIEEILGAEGLTLSATYIGEFWMAGGLFAVILASLILGACAAAWNRVGAKAQGNLDQILFASGFFAAGLCMRSFLGVMPTILPTLALYLFREWHIRYRVRHRSRPRNI
jgi:oligosaccharide repeat unit polymerase